MNTLFNARFSLVFLTVAAAAATTDRPAAAPPADRVLLAPHRAITTSHSPNRTAVVASRRSAGVSL
jgi:hypothetical protein